MATTIAVRTLHHSTSPLRSCIKRTHLHHRRNVQTLSNNPHIYIHPAPTPNAHLLSLLPTTPANPRLAIGTTTTLPPTPDTFTDNPHFLSILHSAIGKSAKDDPTLQSEALFFSSPGGNAIFSARSTRRASPSPRKGGSAGAGAANYQGGAGGGGVGGYLHIKDLRNLPAFGRIPDPMDIIGSVRVGPDGKIEEEGYEECKAYRVITNDGVLGLSEFLRERVVEALKEEERREGR